MKNKILAFIKNEAANWSRFDKIWVALTTMLILAISLYMGDTAAGVISALTGVWYTVFAGNGKRSCFIFGTVNVLLYAYLSYKAHYYGEVMLNLIYYFPMNFVGWFMWKHHTDSESGQVAKRRLTLGRSAVVYGATAVGIFAYGFVLKAIGGSLPFVDALTTIVSVTAQLLAVWRYAEQWVLWIIVNSVTVVMWGINYAGGEGSVSVLLMWAIYLANAIIMLIRWNRETKRAA